MSIEGLNKLENKKPKCINDFLNNYGVASSSIFLMKDKTSVSYNGEELLIKRLNRGNLKRKYGDRYGVSNDKARDLRLLRSASVDTAIEKRIPNLKNNETLKNTLISMNRLCEELSLYKNMRRATNIWVKNLLQVRFVVNTEEYSSDLIGVLNCMDSFLDTVKGLDFKNHAVKSEFLIDVAEYGDACKYITEWLIYTNMLDIIISFITKGCTHYENILSNIPTKANTKRYEDFETKLSNLDDVSVMLASELLKTTQNLDVKDFGKQKKAVFNHILPFDVDYTELNAKTGMHTNVLKVISLLVAFIDSKNWGRLEFIEYYENLLSCLVSSLHQDHVTNDEFQINRGKILNFHKKYGVKISKVKSYSKSKEVNGFTKIAEIENMDFIAYRELIGTLSDMQKSLYDLRVSLSGEKNKLNECPEVLLKEFR